SDPSLTKSQNLQSVWCYQFDELLNMYTLQTTSFLQEEMIDAGSGAYPLFYDWDHDGLQDMFIGNYGIYDSSNYVNGFLNSYYASSIAYYRNTGTTTEPKFKLITTDFGNLKQYNYKALYPAFGDLDGNGEPELICGNSDGNLLYFSHYPFTVPDNSFADIHVGNYSTPQLFDLDGDGKLDLLIGNRRGQIAYYKNNSTSSSLQFELITPTLGNVDVRDFSLSYFGYSTPCFFKNNRNETVLFCGSEQGKIYYYKNIDHNLSGSFELVATLFETFGNSFNEIIEGIRIGVGVTELNQNGYPDLAVGNFAGGLSFFNGVMPPAIGIATYPYTQNCKLYPNPTQSNVSIEGENMIQIDIYNPLGQLMQNIDNQNKKTKISLHLQNFPSGIYLIRITTRHQIESHKLILID
ncbi:MAG: T9SS type A sorting domain-containing protein, partial [Bacteroidales bacterium]